MYRECEPHVVAKDVTPNVTIEMVNGDMARFIFPIYNDSGNGKLEPVDISEWSFKSFLGDNPKNVTSSVSIDGGYEEDSSGNRIKNGLRVHFASRIYTKDLDKYEWPIKVQFNVVGSPDGMFGKGSKEDSFVHGEIIIEKAPYDEVKSSREVQ